MLQKALILAGAVLFVAAAYFLLRDEFEFGSRPDSDFPTMEQSAPVEPIPPRAPLPADPEPTPASDVPALTEAPPSAPPPLPPLDESDSFVRERLADFDLPEAWLARDDLVRRLAVLVDNATRGELAHKRLRFLVPQMPFRVIERDGKLYADPLNARRFDSYMDRLEGVPPAEAARFLSTIGPLLDAALDQLGQPTTAREALREATERVLETDAPISEPQLVRTKVLYQYADPELEGLPPFEKQLLRIGPRNLERLKRYLEAVDRELR